MKNHKPKNTRIVDFRHWSGSKDFGMLDLYFALEERFELRDKDFILWVHVTLPAPIILNRKREYHSEWVELARKQCMQHTFSWILKGAKVVYYKEYNERVLRFTFRPKEALERLVYG